ncbi:hypothetical protein [Kineococcus arenarius]|uniref:hypothetical protein n=1 Tax=unclassified Kineococcus TaxID=2621656 RepID=UPI003D7EFBC4
MSGPVPGARGTATGLGRVLVALYAVFAVAAVSRAGVQIATRFGEAPLAYSLSALAGLVYVVATLGLARTGPRWRRTARIACTVELLGVLAVGTLSLADAAAFPDDTVWSAYGRGYLFIPLVLPVLGLVYLRSESRHGSRRTPRP